MDAVADPLNDQIVCMKSSQVGWTEIIGNVSGYFIHQDPSPILIVQPTVEMGEAWSRDRLSPMLRDSPSLRGLVAPTRGRDASSTLLHKKFPGGQLTIAGANSPASLASRPIRVVLLDEVDRYPPSAGSEGDPVTLAIKRTTNFWNRRILIGSTPTIEGKSRIETAYEQSDKRIYLVPCPHCNHPQRLVWKQVKWENDDPSTARYYCESCGVGWHDGERWSAIRNAERNGGGWHATAPFNGIAGFHINELMSTWVKLRQTVSDYLNARSKPETFKAWVNTALGETWQEKGDAPEWERLIERREDYPMGRVPEDALVITAGTDVQGDRIETDVWGWGEGNTSWLIEHVVIPGSPRDAATWDEWKKRVLDARWAGTIEFRLTKVCVDTGGQDTAEVYKHLRRMNDPRIAPTKGVDGWNRAQPVSGPTMVDVKTNGGKVRRGLRLWTVATWTWKSDLYRRLWLSVGDDGVFPDGWVHLPKAIDPEWVKQLVAEQLRTVKDTKGFSRQEWAKIRDRNEALDNAVLARSALFLTGADRYGAVYWTRLRAEIESVIIAPGSQGSRGPASIPQERGNTGTGEAQATRPPETPRSANPPVRESQWLRKSSGWLGGNR